MCFGAIERRDRGHGRCSISIERSAHRRRNGVGGEGPRALTADSTWCRRGVRHPLRVRRRARHARWRGRRGARPWRGRRRGRRRSTELGEHLVRDVETLVHRDDRRALIGVEDHRITAFGANFFDRRLHLVEDRLHELGLPALRLLLELLRAALILCLLRLDAFALRLPRRRRRRPAARRRSGRRSRRRSRRPPTKRSSPPNRSPHRPAR